MRGFSYKKAVQALNVLALKNGGTINKMKAIKLIWLADRLHLRKYGRTITGDIYFALPHGPVPSTTRDILQQNDFSLSEIELEYTNDYLQSSQYVYTSINAVDAKVFSKTDVNSIDIIYKEYGHFGAFDLRDISHKFPEWKRYQSALEKRVSSRFEIQFEDFFEDIDDVSKLFVDNPDDIKISKEIFEDSLNLRSIY